MHRKYVALEGTNDALNYNSVPNWFLTKSFKFLSL